MTDSATQDAGLCDAEVTTARKVCSHFTEPARAALSGAEAIVDVLLNHGTKRVLIFPGATIAPILDVIEKRTDIEIVCPRNEQGAGYAALAHAALTGKLAIFMVTSGPGVTDAIAPIADAKPLAEIGDADWDRMLETDLRGPFADSQETLPAMTAKHWGRIGTAEDIAAAVVFLCSGEASYITGPTLNVNGGLYFQ